MKIDIIHGANINILEKRESFYGKFSYSDLKENLLAYACKKGAELSFFCSNHEGQLIEAIQNTQNPLIINLAAFSHTSLALADTLKSLAQTKIEVHLTNIHARNRHTSLTAAACNGCITGLGINGYYLAIDYLCGQN